MPYIYHKHCYAILRTIIFDEIIKLKLLRCLNDLNFKIYIQSDFDLFILLPAK